jgi:hypothetical protein
VPRYTDKNGRAWNLQDWPGSSYKATVINAAYRSGAFEVISVAGQDFTLFTCFWCGAHVTSAAVEGDHVANQRMGASASEELQGLYTEVQGATNRDGSPWNLVLSCSECNGGSRNKQKRMTRGDYRRDRDAQKPQPA